MSDLNRDAGRSSSDRRPRLVSNPPKEEQSSVPEPANVGRVVMLPRGAPLPDGWGNHNQPEQATPGWQETFDLVARHMLTQRVPARMGDGRNRYRTPDGLVCAVGILIPDGAYSGDLEGLSAADPFVASVLMRRGHSPGICLSLQRIHDDVRPRCWPGALRQTAMWFRLSAAVIDELKGQFLANVTRRDM